MKKHALMITILACLLSAASAMAAPPACEVKAQIAGSQNGMAVNENSTNQLNGEPSKNAATFSWTQTSGPAVTLSATNVAKPTFTAPEVGPGGAQLIFKLTVTGCSSPLPSEATIVVNVNDVSIPDANRAPTASFTITSFGTQTSVVNEGDPVVLDGSSSTDPDNDALIYAWEQIGGPSVGLPAGNSPTATFNAPQVPYPDGATLTFQLTVSDGILSNATNHTVTVKWVNDPPTAAATCPTSVDELSPVTLDGSKSTDDGDISTLSYAWVQSQALPFADIPAGDLMLKTLTFTAPQLTSNIKEMKFRLTVTDTGSLYNSDECTVTVLDKTPPKLTMDNVTTEATSPEGATVVFDPAPVAKDAVDGPVAITCNHDSGTTFSLGKTVVTCSAADKAGNSATGTFDVTVQDTTAPVIALHDNMTAEATGPDGAIVTYDSPTTVDLVDGAGIATCLPASGSTFPLGKTDVACSASDRAGNKSTASFTITVQDTTPPVIASHDNMTAEATGPTGAAVHYTSPATVDLVDGTGTATCSPASGATFALGTTLVTCNASDKAGNPALAVSFNVIVRDTTPPVIESHGDVTATATGTSGAAVSYALPVTTDLVDGQGTATCLPASGSTFPLGTTTVTCGTTDKAGNSASATTFKVTVNYGFNGLLAPYVVGKAYKVKSTIPVKWQYTNSAGTPMPSSASKPVVLIYYVNANDTVATDALLIDDAGNSGYQYDSTTNTWQFNWKTTGLALGTYHIYVQSTQTGQKDCPYPVQLTK